MDILVVPHKQAMDMGEETDRQRGERRGIFQQFIDDRNIGGGVFCVGGCKTDLLYQGPGGAELGQHSLHRHAD